MQEDHVGTADVLDNCARLRTDLAEALAAATGQQERSALSEALDLVSAAHKALQRDASVTEHPPPPGGSLSPVETVYATPAPGSSRVGEPSAVAGARSVDGVAPAGWLDEPR